MVINKDTTETQIPMYVKVSKAKSSAGGGVSSALTSYKKPTIKSVVQSNDFLTNRTLKLVR